MPGKTASKSRTSATKNSNSKQNTGPNEPQLLQRAKWVEKRSDHAERDGQTLATRNHDVIQSWAEERGGQPATTTREGPPRVLRIDFPGYGGSNLRKIDWNDWFSTFDDRDVTFIYQERLGNGNESNFFRLTNPHREDA
ncbi:MAG TPA: hypothetical protein VFY10_14380 [Dehalococcoidia bacterium]|nr:hypothetical protein [Dehalococcoidia bacterium]